MYKSVPTYYNGKWIVTDFETKDNFIEFILSIFSEPGEYGFTILSKEFNREAKIFNEQGFYCNKPLDQKILLLIGKIKKSNVEKG